MGFGEVGGRKMPAGTPALPRTLRSACAEFRCGLIEAGFWLGGWLRFVRGFLCDFVEAEGLADFADLCGVAGWVDG